jgi:hypothetical protein
METASELNLKKVIKCTDAIFQVNKMVRRYVFEKYDDQAKIIRYIDYFEYRKYELENDYKKEMLITNVFGKFDNIE